METILWMLEVAWKLLAIYMGFVLFRFILKEGRGTFKDLLRTINLWIQGISLKIRRNTAEYLKEEVTTEPPTPKTVGVTMTEEEFKEWMTSHPKKE